MELKKTQEVDRANCRLPNARGPHYYYFIIIIAAMGFTHLLISIAWMAHNSTTATTLVSFGGGCWHESAMSNDLQVFGNLFF